MNYKIVKIVSIAILSLIIIGSLFLVHKVVSEDEDEGTGEGEEGEGFEEFGKGLGVLAVALAFLFNLLYVFQKVLRSAGIKVPIKNIWLLRFHIISNALLGLAGIYHGYLYLNRAGLVEYILVAFIMVIIVSGMILRYAKNRKLKIFAKLIHAQRLISIILIILVGIHMAIIED